MAAQTESQPAPAEPDADVEMGEAGQAATGQPASASSPSPAQQTQPPSQSSIPPPPPPPGPRAARLQDLFRSSLTHTLARLSWDNFAACYPTAAARNPTALHTVHAAMVERLRELCMGEFAAVLRSRQVVQRLNELEGLVDDARQRRSLSGPSPGGGDRGPAAAPTPPHTLPPETILAAHLAPQRRAQKEALEARLRASHAANAARFAQLAAQQAEAEQLASLLEHALADAEAAAVLLERGAETEAGAETGDGKETASLLDELARETRQAEAEMGA